MGDPGFSVGLPFELEEIFGWQKTDKGLASRIIVVNLDDVEEARNGIIFRMRCPNRDSNFFYFSSLIED